MDEKLQPPFQIEGPDANGNAWLVTAEGRQKLGAWDDAAEVMSEWLGSVEYLERG